MRELASEERRWIFVMIAREFSGSTYLLDAAEGSDDLKLVKLTMRPSVDLRSTFYMA